MLRKTSVHFFAVFCLLLSVGAYASKLESMTQYLLQEYQRICQYDDQVKKTVELRLLLLQTKEYYD